MDWEDYDWVGDSGPDWGGAAWDSGDMGATPFVQPADNYPAWRAAEMESYAPSAADLTPRTRPGEWYAGANRAALPTGGFQNRDTGSPTVRAMPAHLVDLMSQSQFGKYPHEVGVGDVAKEAMLMGAGGPIRRFAATAGRAALPAGVALRAGASNALDWLMGNPTQPYDPEGTMLAGIAPRPGVVDIAGQRSTLEELWNRVSGVFPSLKQRTDAYAHDIPIWSDPLMREGEFGSTTLHRSPRGKAIPNDIVLNPRGPNPFETAVHELVHQRGTPVPAVAQRGIEAPLGFGQPGARNWWTRNLTPEDMEDIVAYPEARQMEEAYARSVTNRLMRRAGLGGQSATQLWPRFRKLR